MLKGEAAYEDDHFVARIGADYMTKRYFTYFDDQSVPARVLGRCIDRLQVRPQRLPRRFRNRGQRHQLTDKTYISTIGSNGFIASGDNQTLLTGAPRQWFVTVKRGI